MSRFGKLMLRSGLSVAAMCMAGSATAAEYLITYTGTVRNSLDRTGVFGGSGNSLNGLSFTSVFTLNDAIQNPGSGVQPGGRAWGCFGGSANANGGPPPVTATLTINGVTRTSSGQRLSSAYQGFNPGFYSEIFHRAQAISDSQTVHTIASVEVGISEPTTFIQNVDYTQPLSHFSLLGLNANVGAFNFEEYDFQNLVFLSSASGRLYADSVTVAALGSGTGAVPEPASWMLMIAGFGFVGGAMRRGKGRQRQPIRTVCNISGKSFQT
jgi:hypothetical protein